MPLIRNDKMICKPNQATRALLRASNEFDAANDAAGSDAGSGGDGESGGVGANDCVVRHFWVRQASE